MELYHKDYATWNKLWDQYESVIDGKPAINNHLYKYGDKEKQEDFDYRKKLTSYHGIPSGIVSVWRSIFSKSFISEKLPDPVKQYTDNVDNSGTDLKEARAMWFEECAIYDDLWGCVDALDETYETAQQEIDAGQRPYMTTISRPHITNWQQDKFGKLKVVIRRLRETKKDKTVYMVYTPEMFYEVTEKGKGDKESGLTLPNGDLLDVVVLEETVNTLTDSNGFKILPWVRKGSVKSKKYPDFFKSFIDGISDTSIELFNISSQLNNMFTSAGFQFLAGPDVGDITTFGTKSYWGVPAGGMLPQWIAPAAELYRVYFEREDALVRRIYQQSGVKDRTADSSAAAKSAAQVVVEDKRSEDRVGLIATTVRDFEMDMWKLMCYRAGAHAAADSIDIEYPAEYDTKTLQEEIERLETIDRLRNRDYYLYAVQNMLNRVVANPKERAKIYRGFERSVNVRFEDVANSKAIQPLLEIGAIGAADLARDINPKFNDEKDDAVILEAMKKNAEQYTELKNDLGIGGLTFEEPTGEVTGEETEEVTI